MSNFNNIKSMNMKNAILTLVILSSFTLFSQSDCDGSRYTNYTFTDVNKQVNIQYGQNVTIGGNNKTLVVDFYEPEGDLATKRPLVILAHGGTFISGDQTDLDAVCIDLAKKGYTVGSINYRLIDAFTISDSSDFAEVVIMTMHDMRAAIKYFKNDAATDNLFKIDTNRIIIGGFSAGGIIASHAFFLDQDDDIPAYIQTHINNGGGFDGNSNDLTNTTNVAGLLNFSGSLAKDDWITTNDLPFFSAHDELDDVVYCGYENNDLFGFDLYSYGSCAMNTKATAIGLENPFYLIEGSDGHVSYASTSSPDFAGVTNQSSIYMYEVVCPTEATSVQDKYKLPTVNIFPNPSTNGFVKLSTDSKSTVNYEIIQIDGKKVLEGIVNQNSELRLASGSYLIKFSSNESVFRTEKLLVK